MASKRTEITVETDQILIIRRRGTVKAWCPLCRCKTDVVEAADAEAITAARGQSRQTRSARAWHFCEGGDRGSLICLESVLKSL